VLVIVYNFIICYKILREIPFILLHGKIRIYSAISVPL
jgi:hypothetical protein